MEPVRPCAIIERRPPRDDDRLAELRDVDAHGLVDDVSRDRNHEAVDRDHRPPMRANLLFVFNTQFRSDFGPTRVPPRRIRPRLRPRLKPPKKRKQNPQKPRQNVNKRAQGFGVFQFPPPKRNEKRKNAVRPCGVRDIIWRARHPVLHSSVRRRRWEKADAAAEELAERGTDLEV